MPEWRPLHIAGALLAGVLVSLSPLAGQITSGAEARTVSWARAADAATLDPHALDEGYALTLNQQIYEPLMVRDAQGKILPALAESWSLTSDPQVWEFRLRRGVAFHDGTPFTADDVVFSVERGRQATSGISPLLQSIEQVTRVDSHLVRIRTRGPTPLLPANLTHLLIMSKAWTEKHGAGKVPDAAGRVRAHTFRNANGTGPFALVSREIGLRTVMRRNDAYWGNAQAPVEITELVYRPIPNDTERVQALVSGEVDFLQDVPVNELPRLQSNKAITVSTGPENRAIFLGLNVGQSDLETPAGRLPNPLANRGVREAISTAINRQVIQRSVLLGQSIPTGTVAPSSINGYPRQLDRFPAHDVARAKALLSETGFGSGFRIKLDCPREGYARAEAVCRAIAAQLGQVGITVEPEIRSLAEHMALVRANPPKTDFYLLGFGVSSFDSEEVLLSLFHSRDGQAGQLNATRYSNPEIDRLAKSLSGQIDFTTRTQAIAQAWKLVQDEMIYIPLHIQTLVYAMKPDLMIGVDIENQPMLRFARIRQTIQ